MPWCYGYKHDQPSTIDLTTLQIVVASLQANVDVILEMRGTEPGSVPIELAEDTVLESFVHDFCFVAE